MNARLIAGLAVGAAPIMFMLGAAPASANVTSVSAYHNTVEKFSDPPPSVAIVRADPHSVVRSSDMAAHELESPFAEPQDPQELAAIRQSWDESFCHDADGGVSKHCRTHGH
jgi:hypothetical protein